MHLTINDSLYVDSEGHGYRLRSVGQTNTVSYFGTLPGVAYYLVKQGIIPPDDAQLCWAVSNLCIDLANGFLEACGDHAAAVERGAVVKFGAGRFSIIPNGPGGYYLLNPTRDVPLLSGAEFRQECIVAAYPASVRHAFQLAVERVLQCGTGEIPYTALNTTFLELAKGLFGDAVIALANGEIHAVKPVPVKPYTVNTPAEELALRERYEKGQEEEREKRRIEWKELKEQKDLREKNAA